MQAWAEAFYKSAAWTACRASYIKTVGGLCERCRDEGRITAGVIVHHKTHLTRANISDPTITLNFANLKLVCRDCHGIEHRTQRRWRVDELGRVVDE